MTRIYFFALALCCTTAAQAQDARSTDYDMAVEARLAGDAARAAALLEPLIAANPATATHRSNWASRAWPWVSWMRRRRHSAPR